MAITVFATKVFVNDLAGFNVALRTEIQQKIKLTADEKGGIRSKMGMLSPFYDHSLDRQA